MGCKQLQFNNYFTFSDYPNTITVNNAYESNRNLITSVDNKYGSTTISKYDYTNDALGRRSDMEKSGTAFTASDTINYTYNDKSEVTGADATTDANYDFGFDYDQIGNRKTYDTTESGSNVQSVYSANNLNQYTAVTNPSQSPTYDDDGNMLTMTLASGSWTNTFNAENRIIAQEKSDARLEYVYDYMGRRVEKKVYSGSTGAWTLDKNLKFVYDKYEQIQELNGASSDAVLKKRIWGNDKIVADIHGVNTYYSLGDGNKNITEYLDSTGTIQAHYEYSPFGKITKSSGIKKDDFDYRFSSEYIDTETELGYYIYRYYSAELGRCLSKAPIAERGGYNLYGMVGNNSVNGWDYLGECTESEKGKKRWTEEDIKIIPSTLAQLNPDEYDKWSKVLSSAIMAAGLAPPTNLAEMILLGYSIMTGPNSAVIGAKLARWLRSIENKPLAIYIKGKCETCKCKSFLFWSWWSWDGDSEWYACTTIDEPYTWGGGKTQSVFPGLASININHIKKCKADIEKQCMEK